MAECIICLQQLRSPVRVLPCCHSYCLDCLRHLRNRCGIYNFDDGTISVKCPNCRQEARLDKGKVSTLPTNFALNKLLEACAVATSVTTVTGANSRSNRRVQQSVPSVNEAESNETSSVFYERIHAQQTWPNDIAHQSHGFSSTEDQTISENMIARFADEGEQLEEEMRQPGYWGDLALNYLQLTQAVVNPIDSVYVDEKLQFERVIQNQQIHPAVNSEPYDIYTVLTFEPLDNEIPQSNHEYLSIIPNRYPSPLSHTPRTADTERNAQSFRSFSDRIRRLSVAIENLRFQIDEFYDNVTARLEEARHVTDAVTTSETDENFDSAITPSKFEISSTYNETNFETVHDSTCTTLERVTGEFTDFTADHGSATKKSESSHENY